MCTRERERQGEREKKRERERERGKRGAEEKIAFKFSEMNFYPPERVTVLPQIDEQTHAHTRMFIEGGGRGEERDGERERKEAKKK